MFYFVKKKDPPVLFFQEFSQNKYFFLILVPCSVFPDTDLLVFDTFLFFSAEKHCVTAWDGSDY